MPWTTCPQDLEATVRVGLEVPAALAQGPGVQVVVTMAVMALRSAAAGELAVTAKSRPRDARVGPIVGAGSRLGGDEARHHIQRCQFLEQQLGGVRDRDDLEVAPVFTQSTEVGLAVPEHRRGRTAHRLMAVLTRDC